MGRFIIDPAYIGVAEPNANVRSEPLCYHRTLLAVEGIQLVNMVTYRHVCTICGAKNGLLQVMCQNGTYGTPPTLIGGW